MNLKEIAEYFQQEKFMEFTKNTTKNIEGTEHEYMQNFGYFLLEKVREKLDMDDITFANFVIDAHKEFKEENKND